MCSKKGRLVLMFEELFMSTSRVFGLYESICLTLSDVELGPRAGRRMFTAVWILQFTVLIVFCIGTFVWAGTTLEVHVYLSYETYSTVQVLPCTMYLSVDQQQLVISI